MELSIGDVFPLFKSHRPRMVESLRTQNMHSRMIWSSSLLVNRVCQLVPSDSRRLVSSLVHVIRTTVIIHHYGNVKHVC
jgi:hypothetical protein